MRELRAKVQDTQIDKQFLKEDLEKSLLANAKLQEAKQVLERTFKEQQRDFEDKIDALENKNKELVNEINEFKKREDTLK